jgi:Arc/MetJ family transcription regulator
MRANSDIEHELMEQALRVSGRTTRRNAVEAGLKLLVQVHGQTAIRQSRGKVEFWPEVLEDPRI